MSRTLPILDATESADNERKKQRLIQLIKTNEVILFVGSGCSVGVPMWYDAISKLLEYAHKLDGKFQFENYLRMIPDDPLEMAEIARKRIESTGVNKYYKKLSSIFSTKTISTQEFHKQMCNMPFKGIVTTNYDDLLEKAMRSIDDESKKNIQSISLTGSVNSLVGQFFVDLDTPKVYPNIFHLHGMFNSPKEIILTRRDYSRHYGEKDDWTLLKSIIWSLLATRRILFVGFSFNDEYFKLILNVVANKMWTWEDDKHYAIMSVTKKNKKQIIKSMDSFKNNYGIEFILYENYEEPDGSRPGFDKLIDGLASECGVKLSKMETLNEVNEKMKRKLFDTYENN